MNVCLRTSFHAGLINKQTRNSRLMPPSTLRRRLPGNHRWTCPGESSYTHPSARRSSFWVARRRCGRVVGAYMRAVRGEREQHDSAALWQGPTYRQTDGSCGGEEAVTPNTGASGVGLTCCMKCFIKMTKFSNVIHPDLLVRPMQPAGPPRMNHSW